MKKFLFLFLILNILLIGQSLKPTKISTPPLIDGILNPDEWQNVLSINSFKTFSPDFGKDASQKTIAYASYDSENLYFAFECYDSEPDKIKTSVAKRDNIGADDWVCINLDSYCDQQSLYAFYINPNGIQTDSRFAAGIEDFSADFVWYSAGKVTERGFNVEIEIPLKSIRYSSDNPVMMSIFFERYISRLSEHSSFPELDPAKGMAFLVQMKPLEYYDLKNYTLLEILPAFTYSHKYKIDKNDLNKDYSRGELSLTAKYGITSDLTMDATYNPDFSQIEADAGQVDVNLRYALYYPEKRPFFLEGNEIFNFAGTATTTVDPLSSLVHTRTIVNPLTGFKLSGKIGSKNTLALLYAADELPDEIGQGDFAHFPILRYKRAFEDDSYLGAIYTGRETQNSFNRVLGADAFIRVSQSGTIEINGIYSQTKSSNDSDAKPGSVINLGFNSGSRDIDLEFSLKNISKDFYVESGYLTRNAIFTAAGLIKPKIYFNSDFFQRLDLEVFTAQTQDKPSNLWETYNHASAHLFFAGSYNAKVRYNYSTEIYTGQKFNTNGITISLGGQPVKQLAFSISYSYKNAIYYSANPYQGNSDRVSAVIVYKPHENIESNTNIVFSDFNRGTDNELIYEYPIFWERLTYQFNQYLLLRGIIQYNKFRSELLTDFLISFTYVPGTVIHLGYGSLYQKTEWNEFQNRYIESDKFIEQQRGFFFKVSYLWRN